MASDSKDVADRRCPGPGGCVVELDDHHDSDIINRGLAADAGYRGTFLHEAENDLEELRATFRRKAHTAAMERCLTALLRAEPDRPLETLGEVVLGDLPRRRTPRRCCAAAPRSGSPAHPDALVLVDHEGTGHPPGGRADGAAPGPLHAHLDRRQRALLPRPAAHPLPRLRGRPGAARRRRRAGRPALPVPCSPDRSPPDEHHARRPGGRLPPGPADDRGPRPRGDRPVRRRRADRRGRRVPHRPAHPRGAVGREVPGRPAVHDRPRERGLGARRRLRGHQRRRGRQGHRPPAHHLRAVPRLPLRRRRALREQRVPRHRQQRRLRRVPQDLGPQRRQARRRARAVRCRGAGRRRAHRVPRGGQGGPPPDAARPAAWSSAPAASGTSASRCSRR